MEKERPTEFVPRNLVLVIRRNPDTGQRESVRLRWGLVPSWADDPAIGTRLTHARAETVATKRAFREAFRQRRCLMVVDGFYLWKSRGRGRKKQPYVIQMKDRHPFGVGAVWERWQPPEGEPLESCAVITTVANDVVRPINDRMPVIIPSEDYEDWLNPGFFDAQELDRMMAPFPPGEMAIDPAHHGSTSSP